MFRNFAKFIPRLKVGIHFSNAPKVCDLSLDIILHYTIIAIHLYIIISLAYCKF